MAQAIDAAIPDPDFSGLAVIDFESWRPTWWENYPRNFGIYRDKSCELVASRYPHLSEEEIAKKARQEFELAAKYVFIMFSLFVKCFYLLLITTMFLP